MSVTKLIFISDIHLTGKRPESEDVVIRAFVDDVKKQLSSEPSNKACVLIGGDLVQAADDPSAYISVYEKIIVPLMKLGIKKRDFFLVPGNHDIQRSWIEANKDAYVDFLNQQFQEMSFDDIVETKSDFLIDKFSNYLDFVELKFGLIDRPSIAIGYDSEIDENWSLFCLNTAVTSFAGVGCPDKIELEHDTKRLNVDTRRLYDWVGRNKKRKILLMHHPFEELTEWASIELKKICRLHFDLVLTGHVHEQDILCNNIGPDSYVWCQAPQLNTRKSDRLGYSIINLTEDGVDSIVYREWFEKRNAFRAGLDFTEDDSGIVWIESKKATFQDATSILLEGHYNETMSVFGSAAHAWIDRFFSLERFDRSFRFRREGLFSEDDILHESEHNIKIITPGQYGLTSFAWHYLLRLWKEQGVFGLYLDCELIKRGKVSKQVDNQLLSFSKNKDEVKKIVIDNWKPSDKDAELILAYLTTEFPGAQIVILCPLLEKKLAEIEIVTNNDYDFVNLYMAPLQNYQVRKMVDSYNKNQRIGEDEIVLDRLNADIQNFNMHKTPLSCISLLEVFSHSFDENPVNRTEVIKRLLDIIFENEVVPTYKSLPDVKDCEFAMGFFCEKIVRNETFYFKEREICDEIDAFCKRQKLSIDVNFLFQILLNNQIICQYDSDLYGFRFAFWVYYFAAKRMTHSREFAEFILKEENYAHYPEVIEFYTGSDRSRADAAAIVASDIEKLTAHVHDKVGIPDDMNPFKQLKYAPSPAQTQAALKRLEESLQKSSLPTNIKDALVDESYNPSLPYHQEVYKVFKNYSVSYLQEMIEIASKTLRNSDYIPPEIKESLFDAITNAWFNTIRVICLMAPALAKDSEAGYDGFNLFLASSFDKYNDDLNAKLIQIIISIPFNIIAWYKDDFYTSKLSDLIADKIQKENNPIVKHILVSILIRERPNGWDTVVTRYLSENDSSSFYFGDTIDNLKSVFSNAIMTDQDLAKTKNLILLAYTKLLTGGKYLLPGKIKELNKNKILPERLSDDSENEF